MSYVTELRLIMFFDIEQMGLHQFVGGITGPGYSLFHLIVEKLRLADCHEVGLFSKTLEFTRPVRLVRL